MRKAVIYARVSPRPIKRVRCHKCEHRFIRKARMRECPECGESLPPEQQRGSEDSVKAQVAFCRRYCELYGYEVIAVLADRRLSGKTIERKKFKRAIRLAVKHKAVLVVYSTSRAFRNVGAITRLPDYLHERGAALASCKEHIDTTTAFGWLCLGMRGLVDDFERRQTVERTRDMMRSYQSVGRRMSAEPPLGKCVDPENPGRLIDDPAELAVIDRVHEMASDPNYQRKGKPWVREIARQLDREGHPSRGKGWNVTAVIRILQRASTGTAATP